MGVWVGGWMGGCRRTPQVVSPPLGLDPPNDAAKERKPQPATQQHHHHHHNTTATSHTGTYQVDGC